MEWLSTVLSRKDPDPNATRLPDPEQPPPNPPQQTLLDEHKRLPPSRSNSGLQLLQNFKKDVVGDEQTLPVYKRFRDKWYGSMLAALPALVGVDLIFVGFLFLWRLGTPQTASYLIIGCIFAILLSVAVSIMMWTVLPVFVSMAIAMGTLVGHAYYCSHFLQVWSYDMKAGYTGVHAATPAKSRADAGSIAFRKTTHVDITNSLGYRRGDVYCVAPIVDDAIDDSLINFWAVGLNCCGARDAFRCFDSLDPHARGGMVVASEPISDFHASELAMYRKAAEIAAGEYDLHQAPNAMFVYWITDLAAARDSILSEAYLKFLWSALIFFCFLVPTYGSIRVFQKTATPRKGN